MYGSNKNIIFFINVVIELFWYLLIFCLVILLGLFTYSLYSKFTGTEIYLGNWVFMPGGAFSFFPRDEIEGSYMGVKIFFDIDHESIFQLGGMESGKILGLIHERGTILIPIEPGKLWFLSLFVSGVYVALCLYILGLLRNVVASLKRGTPFIRANAMRLRKVAIASISAFVANDAIAFFQSKHLTSYFDQLDGISQVTNGPSINVAMILTGLLILGIAEIFRIGVDLYEDQALTI